MSLLIPNLTNLQITLKLQLMTAQISLINNLISECDSIIRNMIIDIQKDLKENLNKLEANFIINFCNNLLGFLVLVPSNPDNPFILIQEFINIFTDQTLQKTLLIMKVKLKIYLSLVKFLTTQMQNRLPYYIFMRNLKKMDKF